jgi:exoribonuclease-2
MFPEQLGTGPMSLRAGCRSAAWSLWVELDAEGAIAASGVQRSWVKPTYRLSYGDADDLIDLAPPQERDLADLDGFLQRRRQWRLRHGALLLDQPEGRIQADGEEPLLEITEPSPARLLVAEAMILAGAVVASLLLGVAQAMAAAYLPPGMADILIFATLFVVLIFKPNGLFGGGLAPAGVGRQ